ncbi:outer membrane beta-barrel protein [Lacinutrix sp. C3R15]|uniref:outer membrane beta-barrel protein n=1 Tax=Flavobacteriaceae TaxID=49546 RepID=UPI001C082B74|nr:MULTISPECIES: outer membrane beta-barrel protein [Flavobacteriaceae]MBU2939818.1 outer membrane beta-barrel protein [Lacinutrix sp. C3R15]MDO6623134.1 outer membrane beta-barrel protein [Oceanihabitans sp. 1_MG-2023]
MKPSKILIFVFLILSNLLFGQSAPPIKGIVVNENKAPLEFVSVVLLKQKDSTYINYTITDAKGAFAILDAPKDSLMLQFSYLGYVSHFERIAYKNTPIDLSEVVLKEDSYPLDAVTITAEIPVQIKEDTIAFNANSFKVNSSDNLESLLKKLPGLEVDSNGKVVAQGNEVTKIYVDGKEFFGGDPAIVLKNLPADAIAKVEIIDKKSDEAELTGVDDGNKQIVINFTLKKSKKNQGFGKASAGIGLDSRYFGNLNYNKFSPKTQFAIISKYNNINITGSNIQGFLENADGIADESDDTNTSKTKSLSGYLKTGVGGVNISHSFKEKESFNADYFYNLSDNRGTSFSKRISFSNSNNFDYEADNSFDKVSKNHNFNFNYINKSNKTNSLTIKGRLNADEVEQNTTRDGFYYNEDGDLVTSNIQGYSNNNRKKTVYFNLNYYQKLAKTGRGFSVGFNTNISRQAKDNEQTTFVTRNINSTNVTNTEVFALRDETFNNGLYNFNFKYTEPLAKNHYFKLQSSIKVLNQNEDIYQLKTTITNNNAEEGISYKYNNREGSYQNRFAYNYSTKKLNIFSGVELQELDRSFGVLTEDPFKSSQFYLNPFATLQYKPSKGVKYRFLYNRKIRSPRTTESSTVINDLNPFYIRKGNPYLKTEKSDDFSLIAIIYNYKSSLSFTGRIKYQYATDAIIQNIAIDDAFVKTRSYINSGERKRFTSFFNFSKKIKGLGMRYAIKNSNFYNESTSLINLQLNDVISKDFLLGFSLENSNKNLIDVKLGANYSVNNTSFSIEEDLNRTYRKQHYYSAVDYDFTEKLSFNTQFDYFLFSDNQFDTNLELPIWNMAISYSIGNSHNILKLVLIDLLDRNVDFERRSTTNYFEETTSESLGRYIILSYTYRLGSRNKKQS